MVGQNHKNQENILLKHHIKNDCTVIHPTETGSHFHWQSFCSTYQYICYSHHGKKKKKDVNNTKIKKHPNTDKHLTQASFVVSYEHRDCTLFSFSSVNTKQPKRAMAALMLLSWNVFNQASLKLHSNLHYLLRIYSVNWGCAPKASFSSMSSCCKNNSFGVRPGINTILLHVFAAALLLLDRRVLHVNKHNSRGRSEYLLVNRLVHFFVVLQRKKTFLENHKTAVLIQGLLM